MNQLTEYRREFHKYPENGWREFRTSARVAEILTGMGYDVAMGPDVIEPGSVGEPERLSEEQIRQEMERAVRQGADPAFVKRTQGWPGVMAVLDTGRVKEYPIDPSLSLEEYLMRWTACPTTNLRGRDTAPVTRAISPATPSQYTPAAMTDTRLSAWASPQS